ncbi:RNA-guided endonuclease InsQ/TnpB family protein [Sinomonas sp. G460-2]|uniref:RNA-guided endonuclease InsQ/TnpB family protein n=1 Tax=Sinomonas sp. G460-2 TaxID=3393464 RepID=UPI0039F0C214
MDRFPKRQARGKNIGHPRFKKKGGSGAFRLRNKHSRSKDGTVRNTMRVGETHPRSVTLPGIGAVRVHDDTRPLRRLLAKGRARVLFATVSRRAGRWSVSLVVEASDIHEAHHHSSATGEAGPVGWVGVDRGLSTPIASATEDGAETLRIAAAPRAAKAALPKTRRLSRAVSRKKKGSKNRADALTRLARHHERIRNRRQHFLHQVSNQLAKTHARLAIEDLNVTGMLANRTLAAAIADAAWAELARQLDYKCLWHGGQLVLVDRWFPSSRTCSRCGHLRTQLGLGERTYRCGECGLSIDRDLNAAANLAAWAEDHAQPWTPKHEAGIPTPADTKALAPAQAGTKPAWQTREPATSAHSRLINGRPRRAVPNTNRGFDTL